MTGPDGPGAIARLSPWVSVAPSWSVIRTVKSNEPAWVGVPPRVPSALNASPDGREPSATSQAYSGVPPSASRITE